MCNKRKTVAIETLQEGRCLRFLYRTMPGRLILKLLTCPTVSKMAGAFMNTKISAQLISGFIRKNNMDMEQYEQGPFSSYNAFFSRKVKQGKRVVDFDDSSLISPCDSKLTAYSIDTHSKYTIKGSPYTVKQLLNDPYLAEEFSGGTCLIFRLTVDDYHRYCYLDDGIKSENIFIPGKLHTVQPIAFERYNVYKENCREYTIMETAHFGKVVQAEVGALMVGKICNHHQKQTVRRGEEKGMFQFGGSTIVVLLGKGAAVIDEEILENTSNDRETIVKLGEKIGWAGEKKK